MDLDPLAIDLDLQRARSSREEIARRIALHLAEDGTNEAAPGLFLHRFSAVTGPVARVAEPSFCVILQGGKEVVLGAERYRYDESHYLLVAAGLPLEGRVISASRDRPYLAVRLVLDRALVATALSESRLLAREEEVVRALAVSQLDANLLDAVLRLVRLAGAPSEYAALGPLVVREIVYRLAVGEQGARLRQIALSGARARGIAMAIEILRTEYDKPFCITELARRVAMSESSLYHQFKAVTSMSPLRFRKRLRLTEARRLLVAGECDAASAGYRVGYGDPSHFCREYKRLFGEPPMHDAERLRGTVVRTVPGREGAGQPPHRRNELGAVASIEKRDVASDRTSQS